MKSISDTLGSKINGDLSHKYLKTLILHNCNGDIGRAEANLAEMSSFVDNLNSYSKDKQNNASLFLILY